MLSFSAKQLLVTSLGNVSETIDDINILNVLINNQPLLLYLWIFRGIIATKPLGHDLLVTLNVL
jgi:hypothetical protein